MMEIKSQIREEYAGFVLYLRSVSSIAIY